MSAGWEVKKLKDVCTLINGKAYKKAELLKEGKYRVLRVGNFFTNNHWYYSDLELDEDKYCDNGDLLYAWSASFGPRIWEGEKVIYHYHIWKVVPDLQQITKEFLFMLLYWDIDKIKAAQGTGTTMIHVSKGSMENRLVPIPPIEEQRRIVAVLDEALAGVATAVSNTERNLENGRDLFTSYLQSIFANPADDWKEKTLGDIFLVKHGFAFKSQYFATEGEYVLLTPGNFYEEGGYRDRGEKQKYYVGEVPENFILSKGDLLIAMTEQAAGLLGSPLIVPESDKFLHNQRLGLIIYNPNQELETKFLFYLFNTQRIRRLIHESASGVKVRHTSPKKVLEIKVSIPPIEEQQRIVAQLDDLATQTQQLEAIYEQKLAALTELKQSILQQAFSGKLV